MEKENVELKEKVGKLEKEIEETRNRLKNAYSLHSQSESAFKTEKGTENQLFSLDFCNSGLKSKSYLKVLRWIIG